MNKSAIFKKGIFIFVSILLIGSGTMWLSCKGNQNKEVPMDNPSKVNEGPGVEKSLTKTLEEERKKAETLEMSKDLLEGSVDFIRGNMVHAIPDSMPLHEVSKVALVIGDRDQVSEIAQKALQLSGVKDSGSVSFSGNITIGRKMKAMLRDPKANFSPAFEIRAVTSEEQFVDLYNNQSVDWLWDVIPLKAGQHELSLTLEVILKNDLGELRRSIPVYNNKVNIFISEQSGIPTAYDHVASLKDSTQTTHNSEALSASDPASANYLPALLISGAILVGGLLFFFYQKQGRKTKIVAQAKFSEAQIHELEKLQENGNIKQALRFILDRLPEEDRQRNEVELLWQNYKDNEKDKRHNLISYDQYTQARSTISMAVINLIDDLRDLSVTSEQNNQVV